MLFSTDEPNDERKKLIKIKSGYISYLISIIYIFIITVLFDYGVFSNSLNGFIFILVGTILVFPLTLFYFKKTM
jgi:positive regulator of sigma E activity